MCPASRFQTTAIIGLGLIGGSLGAALRGAGTFVRGYDADVSSATIAERRGLVDSIAPDIEGAVAGADAIILCIPIGAILDLLPRIDALAPPSTLILDTGSVKRPVVRAMSRLPGASRALGGHPLAGKETSGPEGAESAIFHGRCFILTPTDATEPVTLERAGAFVRAIGSRPVIMPAEKHDRTVARTSHLPQILATILAAELRQGDEDCAGPGLRDMIRLAASDPALWRDILLVNADSIVAAAEAYTKRLGALVRAIEEEDSATIEEHLLNGREAARRVRELAA
ncbi:MAG: prephenate dehydrogenase/arogenate dehydrogenase family protein [Chloroflexota bacterium]|nr:prephenate dehydrogenase/arogenate dehydrogenase family protein [Chloroflexota bacterium]